MVTTGMRKFGVVHVSESLDINAPPELLARLYLDVEGWPQLFPLTIHSVRVLSKTPDEIRVEVSHKTAGAVLNIVRPVSATVIELEEFKPKFDATFINRFEPRGSGSRYAVGAEVRLHRAFALLAPVVSFIAPRRIRRFVLEPMRIAAESTH